MNTPSRSRASLSDTPAKSSPRRTKSENLGFYKLRKKEAEQFIHVSDALTNSPENREKTEQRVLDWKGVHTRYGYMRKEEDLAEWIAQITKREQKFKSPEEFIEGICDGYLLCLLINDLIPGSIQAIPDDAEDRVEVFLEKCGNIGVPNGQLFEPVDLTLKKNTIGVVYCIFTLAEVCHKKKIAPFFQGPQRLQEKELFIEKARENIQQGTSFEGWDVEKLVQIKQDEEIRQSRSMEDPGVPPIQSTQSRLNIEETPIEEEVEEIEDEDDNIGFIPDEEREQDQAPIQTEPKENLPSMQRHEIELTYSPFYQPTQNIMRNGVTTVREPFPIASVIREPEPVFKEPLRDSLIREIERPIIRNEARTPIIIREPQVYQAPITPIARNNRPYHHDSVNSEQSSSHLNGQVRSQVNGIKNMISKLKNFNFPQINQPKIQNGITITHLVPLWIICTFVWMYSFLTNPNV